MNYITLQIYPVRKHVFTLQDTCSFDRVWSKQIILLASMHHFFLNPCSLENHSIYSSREYYLALDGFEEWHYFDGLVIQAGAFDSVFPQVANYMVFQSVRNGGHLSRSEGKIYIMMPFSTNYVWHNEYSLVTTSLMWMRLSLSEQKALTTWTAWLT
jgi:hypothetical protein